MQAPDDEKLVPLYQGTQLTFDLPSGNKITIREQNGADEEILSMENPNKKGPDNLVRYLANVTERDERLGRKPLSDDIMLWPLKDKLYAIYRARILNFGDKVKFTHVCDKNHSTNFTEDLTEYDGDFLNPKYTPKSQWSITPYKNYPENGIVKFTLSSGKEVKYNILNSHGEILLLESGADEKNATMGLRARNLQLNYNNNWVTVTDFAVFGPKDMVELRGSVFAIDNPFSPHTVVTCPKCESAQLYNIFFLPNFFYPTEM